MISGPRGASPEKVHQLRKIGPLALELHLASHFLLSPQPLYLMAAPRRCHICSFSAVSRVDAQRVFSSGAVSKHCESGRALREQWPSIGCRSNTLPAPPPTCRPQSTVWGPHTSEQRNARLEREKYTFPAPRAVRPQLETSSNSTARPSFFPNQDNITL